MRKAAQYAIDRPALVRVSAAYLAGRRDDQILPPGIAGYKNYKAVSDQGLRLREGEVASRRRPAGARTSPCTRATRPSARASARCFKYNLSQIGCNVNVKLLQGFQIYIAAGTQG